MAAGSRTKHIDTRHFWVQEQVQDGDLMIKRVPTAKKCGCWCAEGAGQTQRWELGDKHKALMMTVVSEVTNRVRVIGCVRYHQ